MGSLKYIGGEVGDSQPVLSLGQPSQAPNLAGGLAATHGQPDFFLDEDRALNIWRNKWQN